MNSTDNSSVGGWTGGEMISNERSKRLNRLSKRSLNGGTHSAKRSRTWRTKSKRWRAKIRANCSKYTERRISKFDRLSDEQAEVDEEIVSIEDRLGQREQPEQ